VLFGYTDQARLVKRSVTVSTAASRRRWTYDAFFADARQQLRPEEVRALETVYEWCATTGWDVSWGTGRERGSFILKHPSLCQRSVATVNSDGMLSLNFSWLNEDAREEAIRTGSRSSSSSASVSPSLTTMPAAT
jgi:hypothetical protein